MRARKRAGKKAAKEGRATTHQPAAFHQRIAAHSRGKSASKGLLQLLASSQADTETGGPHIPRQPSSSAMTLISRLWTTLKTAKTNAQLPEGQYLRSSAATLQLSIACLQSTEWQRISSQPHCFRVADDLTLCWDQHTRRDSCEDGVGRYNVSAKGICRCQCK